VTVSIGLENPTFLKTGRGEGGAKFLAAAPIRGFLGGTDEKVREGSGTFKAVLPVAGKGGRTDRYGV